MPARSRILACRIAVTAAQKKKRTIRVIVTGKIDKCVGPSSARLRLSLRQLEVFLATAREENITRAASGLAMSQSAASGSLKELEQQFGVKLFDRVGKRLQLSELGRQLRPQAETLLAQAKVLEQALAGKDTMGRLHIGATMTIGNYLAVPMIADFRSRHPAAEIALTVANTEAIAAGVAGFELDMGMIEGEFHHPELETLHWRADELVVFVAPGGGTRPLSCPCPARNQRRLQRWPRYWQR